MSGGSAKDEGNALFKYQPGNHVQCQAKDESNSQKVLKKKSNSKNWRHDRYERHVYVHEHHEHNNYICNKQQNTVHMSLRLQLTSHIVTSSLIFRTSAWRWRIDSILESETNEASSYKPDIARMLVISCTSPSRARAYTRARGWHTAYHSLAMRRSSAAGVMCARAHRMMDYQQHVYTCNSFFVSQRDER